MFFFLSGDYVLRDPAGGPRGIVRVMIKWKYPFQPPVSNVLGNWKRPNRAEENAEREERQREKADVPVAKPRIKVILLLQSFKHVIVKCQVLK